MSDIHVASYPGLPSQLFSMAAKRAVLREGLGTRLQLITTHFSNFIKFTNSILKNRD